MAEERKNRQSNRRNPLSQASTAPHGWSPRVTNSGRIAPQLGANGGAASRSSRERNGCLQARDQVLDVIGEPIEVPEFRANRGTIESISDGDGASIHWPP